MFLVGVNVNAKSFADFCRRDLIDLVGATPDFRTFLLAPDELIRSIPDADYLFGRWPRAFSHAEDLRDTLIDATIGALRHDAGSEVGLILVADNPEAISANDLLATLRKELASTESTRLWTVAVFLSGPNHQAATLGALLDPNTEMIDTAFLIGRDVDGAGRGLSLSQSVNLRIIVDVMRDAGDGWVRVRARRGEPRARVLWFQSDNLAVLLRTDEILQYLKGALAALAANAAADTDTKNFEVAVGQILKDIGPRSEVAHGAEIIGYQPLTEKWLYSDAHREVVRFADHFKMLMEIEYARLLAETRKGFDERDDGHTAPLKDTQQKVEALKLPDGLISAKSKNVADRQLEAVKDWTRRQTEASKAKRDKVLSEHRELQNRMDPDREGRLDFDIVAGGRRFGDAVDAANQASRDLPTSWWTLFGLTLLPLILAASAVLSARRPLMKDALATPITDWWIWAAAAGCLFLLLVPLVGWFSVRGGRRAMRDGFVDMKRAADRIMAFVTDTMAHARDYGESTRATLLGDECARMLKERIDAEPRSHFNRQLSDFLTSEQTLEIDKAGQQEVRGLVADRPLGEWTRCLVRTRLQGLSDQGSWRVTIANEAVSNIVMDTGAIIQEAIIVPSPWVASATAIRVLPLRWQRVGAPPVQGDAG